MAPTLSPDAHETGREDYVIVRPYQERRDGKKRNVKGEKGEDGKDGAIFWGVKRGDVVTFWKPHKPGEMGIKRVVAVEGDTVYPTRGYALDPQSFQNRLKGVPDGLMKAIENVTERGVKTKDLGGSEDTKGVTDAVCAEIETLFKKG